MRRLVLVSLLGSALFLFGYTSCGTGAVVLDDPATEEDDGDRDPDLDECGEDVDCDENGDGDCEPDEDGTIPDDCDDPNDPTVDCDCDCDQDGDGIPDDEDCDDTDPADPNDPPIDQDPDCDVDPTLPGCDECDADGDGVPDDSDGNGIPDCDEDDPAVPPLDNGRDECVPGDPCVPYACFCGQCDPAVDIQCVPQSWADANPCMLMCPVMDCPELQSTQCGCDAATNQCVKY